MFSLHLYHRQSGAVLVLAMVMLVIITILAISMGGQEVQLRKDVTSQRDYQEAFLNANSAMSEAEAVIVENAYDDDSVVLESLVVGEFDESNWWADDDNWDTYGTLVPADDSSEIGSAKYIIEDMGTEGGLMMGVSTAYRQFYRVTAAAEGPSGEAKAYVQTYYAIWTD
jgi:type IV pilus assembly protein PilX